MKKLEEILELWKEDCKIGNNLDEESRRIPSLHYKYLELLTTAKMLLKDTDLKQKILLKQKWELYNGKMSPDEVQKLNWDPDPLNGLKVMKGNMNYYYDSDKEIQESERKVHYYKTMVDTLTDIIGHINWRHTHINNIIKWKNFEVGN